MTDGFRGVGSVYERPYSDRKVMAIMASGCVVFSVLISPAITAIGSGISDLVDKFYPYENKTPVSESRAWCNNPSSEKDKRLPTSTNNPSLTEDRTSGRLALLERQRALGLEDKKLAGF